MFKTVYQSSLKYNYYLHTIKKYREFLPESWLGTFLLEVSWKKLFEIVVGIE